MSTEVTGLKATPTQDEVRLTWGVSSTSYLLGFDVLVEQAGKVIDRTELPASVFSYSATGLSPGVKYAFIVRARVEQGGKTVEAVPLSPPVEPPPVEPPPLPGGRTRIFSDASPYNTPIPASPVLDAHSVQMVSALAAKGSTAMLHEYGGTIYESTFADPVAQIVCKNMDWAGAYSGAFRIPKGAKPVGGSDGSMVVLDTVSGFGVDFWQVQETSPGVYTTSYCSRWPIGGNGVPGYGACGWGEPLVAGMPRVWELEQGHIDHALTFASSLSSGTVRYPASKSDGGNSYPPGIPEGARLQLDPAADLSKCSPAERIIAVAAQKYGLYCNNTTSPVGIGIGFEDAGPVAQGNPYFDLGLTSDGHALSNIPWGQLRVLAKWDGM